MAASAASDPNKPDPEKEAFEYTKGLYGNIIDWYKDVHGRAQAVVTLDGVFRNNPSRGD